MNEDRGRQGAPSAPRPPSPARGTDGYVRVSHLRVLWIAWAVLLGLVLAQGAWLLHHARTHPTYPGPSQRPHSEVQPPPTATPVEAGNVIYSEEDRGDVLEGDLPWLESFLAAEAEGEQTANTVRGLLAQHMIRMNDVFLNEAAGTHTPADSRDFYALEVQRFQKGLELALPSASRRRLLALLRKHEFYPPQVQTALEAGSSGSPSRPSSP